MVAVEQTYGSLVRVQHVEAVLLGDLVWHTMPDGYKAVDCNSKLPKDSCCSRAVA